jgi:hypothetical protein
MASVPSGNAVVSSLPQPGQVAPELELPSVSLIRVIVDWAYLEAMSTALYVVGSLGLLAGVLLATIQFLGRTRD